jgi:galactokinase
MAQRAESDFVGAPVGIMDQLAVLLGRRDAALFIDTRSLSWRFVTFPDAAGLLVIDSGIRHQLASGEYRQRREECARAAAALQVEQLRDLDCRALPVIEALPEPLGRRARHVVTENRRVLQMIDALESNNLPACGALLLASHASLSHDYDVSVPQIDELVRIAAAQRGVFGARLTGAGFGGAVIALVNRDQLDTAADTIVTSYQRSTGAVLRVID